MKTTIFSAMLLFLQIIAGAQQNSKSKFTSLNQVGLVSGTSGNAVQLQTINGIYYKTFLIGAGVGIDNYYIKTIPVFVDMRKNFFNTIETPFIYVDGGINVPWKKTKTNLWSESTFRPGFYGDAGVGYKWLLLKKLFVSASFGFSYKTVNEANRPYYFAVDPVPVSLTNPDYDKYKLQRFSLKLGIGF